MYLPTFGICVMKYIGLMLLVVFLHHPGMASVLKKYESKIRSIHCY